MAQKNQGGSVLGFVVVAVIMAGLLIGGAYALRQLTTAPEQGLEPTKTAEDKPIQEQKQTPANPDEKKEQSKEEPQSSTGSDAPAPSAGELPQTGPGESLVGTILALAALTGVAISYARSRRPELSL